MILDPEVPPVPIRITRGREEIVDAERVLDDLDDRLAMVRVQARPLVTRIESMQRRVWLGLKNSVGSVALKAIRSPTCCPSVWAIVARSPARIRHMRA